MKLTANTGLHLNCNYIIMHQFVCVWETPPKKNKKKTKLMPLLFWTFSFFLFQRNCHWKEVIIFIIGSLLLQMKQYYNTWGGWVGACAVMFPMLFRCNLVSEKHRALVIFSEGKSHSCDTNHKTSVITGSSNPCFFQSNPGREKKSSWWTNKLLFAAGSPFTFWGSSCRLRV